MGGLLATARAARRRRGAVLGALASGAVLAACAGPGWVVPATAEYRPAPRSALVTNRAVNLVTATWSSGDETTTVMARRQVGASPLPMVRLLQRRQGTDLKICVQAAVTPPGSGNDGDLADRGEASLATLEALYATVLRQEPLARYALIDGASRCDVAPADLSHAQALRALAALRERAVVKAPGAAAWQTVEMQAAATGGWDADLVSVRATSASQPLAGLAVYFNRAPYSICAARTQADGVATCRLEDQHGDGAQHDHATAVVATFPGELAPHRVLLPTTQVLPATVRGETPAFARPWAILPVSR